MGTMRPNKYDVTTAYGLCQDYLPPDGMLSPVEWNVWNVKRENDVFNRRVVISGALCTVEDYVIMSQCAHNKAIYLAAEGTVSVTDISQTQNITIVGRPDFVNNNFKIALYAKETQRYLCFNDHWKLVGMKELQDTCYFNEAIVHGYFVFRSVVDLQRRIGFTQRGRAVGPKKTVNDACYMFTKIPTDQFFHQHTHFSVPKMKSTTTKIPKIENTHNPYFINSDRGSGGGAGSVKIKPNRFKNHHRQDDTLTHNYSGSGNGNGSGSKRLKKQRNGNKHKQQRQDMQQQIRGHSFSLSNPKNSTCLNSSKQNLVLSQHNLNNNSHINRKQNSNSNNNNNNHLPQNHQVRHHHNDPNKVARRHQHDQRQKAKQRQRLKSNPPSASTATTMTVVNSTKPHFTLTTSQVGINPTSVSQQILSTTTSAKYNTLSSTIVVSKRKGRRRKSDKLHKKAGLKKKHISEETRDYSKELIDKDQTYTSFVGPNFEEEDEYINSSTDYAWVTNDIMLSSVKPLSASLPSWETWYPSSPTTVTDESSDYLLTSSATASSVTETYSDKRFSTTFESSSMTDLDKNSLSLQTSVPLPTSLFITTLMENSINETISPSITTDSGTTTITTNTSTYSQTDLWSTSLSDNIDLDTNMTDTQVTKYLDNNYATPKLEDVQPYGLNTENFMEDTNASTFSSKDKKEQSEATVTVTIIKNDNKHKSEPVMSTLKEHEEPTIDSNRIETKTTALTKVNNSNNSTYSTAATYNATETTMAIADCIYAMKATTTIANNHQLRPQENRNLSNETYLNRNHHTKFEPATTMATATTTSIKKITLRLPEISPTQSPSPTSMTTSLQLHTLVEDEPVINTAVDIAATATTFSSTKFPVLTPLTTRKTLRKSTQRLLATPFHQLTYVRNEAGDIDIDNIDNISIYPELLDNDNNEPLIKSSTSRLTMISGYLPTSATAILPESIRIAKIKINRERKRMLRLRNIGNYA